MILALAQPEAILGSAGADLIVVVDRSRSMPSGSDAKALELIQLVEREKRPGDRIGVIGFGREPAVELSPSSSLRFGGFSRSVDVEASDLSAALDAALEIVPADRSARVLIISDGKATGTDPRGASRRLAARGIPVDVRVMSREDPAVDLAVVGFEAPSTVAIREPFQLTAIVHSRSNVEATVSLKRNGQLLVKGPFSFKEGDNLLPLRDLVEQPGLASYEVQVSAPNDGVVENDVGRAVVTIEGPQRILVVSRSANGGVIAETLRSAGLEVQARAPGPIDLGALEGVGSVVLENVEASDLTEGGLGALAQYVRHAGGGLVMTGGRKSFGEGGYRKSPVEEVLPVSLEMRQEQRKANIALSLILDCSCSMGATVPDGRTKMKLAGEGAIAALELLNPNDEASVDMVDTVPHELFAMSPVSAGLPLNEIANGFSGGGGIYVGVGLETARDQILRSDKATRHVVLFSDAADSEEAGTYRKTLSELRSQNVTVSVIGMGRPNDSDSDLLREVAALGGGRIYFAEDPTSLPRIFSQETIAVARATFIDADTKAVPGGDLALLGRPPGGMPSVGGYNVTYLKPQASIGMISDDENKSPLVAFWPRGAGRTAVFTGEVDGQYTGPLRQWSGYRALLEQLVRWTIPPKEESQGAVVRAIRKGNDLHVTLDFPPGKGAVDGKPTLMILSGDAKGEPVELPLRWEESDRLGAHFTLPGSGTFHPIVKLGGRPLRAPPVTLPYAPEFEPISAAEGRSVLLAVAKVAGGVERLSMSGIFAETKESRSSVPLAPWLIAAALITMLGEVVTRRFFAVPTRAGRLKIPRTIAATMRGAAEKVLAAAPVIKKGGAKTTVVSPAAEQPAPAQEEAPPPKEESLDDVMKKARGRAKRRTGGE
ncbi:MAG: VWA domain-containing protein, partial [Myxococcaceae bacterium]